MDQERDGDGSRWQVVGTGLGAGALLALYIAAEKVPGPIADRMFALVIFLAGPLNPLLWETVPGLAAVSLLFSPAIFAHPVRPRLLTGAATILAVATWFFAGFGALAVHIGP